MFFVCLLIAFLLLTNISQMTLNEKKKKKQDGP